MRKISIFSGDGVKAKSLRGSALTFGAIGGSNILRLASNLVLTRLLFPEAFGLMALVQVFMTALNLFSDTGTRAAIVRHERGDEPDFLDTAWVIQVVRGVCLWGGACLLAGPAVWFYDEPRLGWLLPIAGIGAIIIGFSPTKAIQANRHLTLGRLTTIELASQAVGLIITAGLAFWLRSIWALVFGGLIADAIKVAALWLFMPGRANRFRFDRDILKDLLNFGKFIFLSTAVTFVLRQGDKAVLGAFSTLADLGIYNVAMILATMPFVLATALGQKVLQPIYRMKPFTDNAANRRNVFRARRAVVAGTLAVNVIFSFSGVWLINFLYDARFDLAGPIVVLASLSLVPVLTFAGYSLMLIAVGDSRRFFLLNLVTGSVQLALMILGASYFGIVGVILAMPLAQLAVHPLRIRWLTPIHGWDPKADAALLGLGFLLTGLGCYLARAEIAVLLS